MVLQSEEPVDKIPASACLFCDDWEKNLNDPKQDFRRLFLNDGKEVEPYGTIVQFRRHLGRHMEQLALFALPMTERDEMEVDSADSDSADEPQKDAAVEEEFGDLDIMISRAKNLARMTDAELREEFSDSLTTGLSDELFGKVDKVAAQKRQQVGGPITSDGPWWEEFRNALVKEGVSRNVLREKSVRISLAFLNKY